MRKRTKFFIAAGIIFFVGAVIFGATAGFWTMVFLGVLLAP